VDQRETPCTAETPSNRRFRCALTDAMPAVRRYGFVLAGDWDVAEDLAQESVLRAWRARASFDGQANVRTWLFAIARNQWSVIGGW